MTATGIRYASVHHKPEGYILYPVTPTTHGVLLADEPVRKLPATATAQEIGAALLRQPRTSLPHPAD